MTRILWSLVLIVIAVIILAAVAVALSRLILVLFVMFLLGWAITLIIRFLTKKPAAQPPE